MTGDLIPGVPDAVLGDELREFEDEFEQIHGRRPGEPPPMAGPQSGGSGALQPVSTADRSRNALRPVTFDDVIGQERPKAMLTRMVQASLRRDEPMDHCLLVGPSGTGKTTLAHVIANALGSDVYQLEAPVSADTLAELAGVMQRGDILFLDEIHQQAVQDRRGRSSNTQPEVLFSVMEDRTLPTASGVMEFPHITIMGATTDEGMLPDAFINRFPVRPRLERYTEADMETIARLNGPPLKVALSNDAARIFAKASRGVPREVNNYVRNAAAMCVGHYIDANAATEVLEMAGVSEDGLTADMQAMLAFLYTRARRYTKSTDEVRYQASVNTIATAIGKSRDSKAVTLRVEPYLIERGYVQVAHGGRLLTDAGVLRAMTLTRS